jgi:hypothetical protein
MGHAAEHELDNAPSREEDDAVACSPYRVSGQTEHELDNAPSRDDAVARSPYHVSDHAIGESIKNELQIVRIGCPIRYNFWNGGSRSEILNIDLTNKITHIENAQNIEMELELKQKRFWNCLNPSPTKKPSASPLLFRFSPPPGPLSLSSRPTLGTAHFLFSLLHRTPALPACYAYVRHNKESRENKAS